MHLRTNSSAFISVVSRFLAGICLKKYTGLRYGILLRLSIIYCMIGGCTASYPEQEQTNSSLQQIVPVKSDVGASNLPDTIGPVEAPFDMPEFKKAEFPAYTRSILETGAAADSTATDAIQQAIDQVNRQGGGRVIIPAGTWKTGRIILKSNVNLHLEKGAELHFSGRVEDYRPAVFTRIEGIEVMSLGACIYANGQENIAITGKGKLVGPPDDSPVRERIMTHTVIENVVDLDKPVSERIHAGETEEWIFPPMFISPINCKNVYIEGITLEHTAFWNIVPIYCDGVIIRGVTVNSVGVPRGDGIDVESSRNVLIEYCTLNTGDDCFTMKSGRGQDGLRVNRATENVVVRYCLAKQGHGGITCGSETAGMIRNLYVHDCVFDDTGVGIRFKTRRPRGGGGENLYYERIRMNLRHTVIKWDMLGSTGSVGDLANRLPFREINELTPVYKNITIRDIIVENGTHFLKIYGIPESPVTNLLIENATVNVEELIIAHDAKGVTIRNAEIQAQDSLIDILDSRNILFDHVNFKVPGGRVVTSISGNLSDSIIFKNTAPQHPKGWTGNSWYRPEQEQNP